MFFLMFYSIGKNRSALLETRKTQIGRNDKKYDLSVSIDWDAYGSLNGLNEEPEDRGVIEAPANSETIIYESPDGETYEISISDLIDADDEGEIEYGTKGRSFFHSGHKSVTRKYVGRTKSNIQYPIILQRQQRFSRIR